jgi:hypothetical protein
VPSPPRRSGLMRITPTRMFLMSMRGRTRLRYVFPSTLLIVPFC